MAERLPPSWINSLVSALSMPPIRAIRWGLASIAGLARVREKSCAAVAVCIV